jgi:hypothetical protein
LKSSYCQPTAAHSDALAHDTAATHASCVHNLVSFHWRPFQVATDSFTAMVAAHQDRLPHDGPASGDGGLAISRHL